MSLYEERSKKQHKLQRGQFLTKLWKIVQQGVPCQYVAAQKLQEGYSLARTEPDNYVDQSLMEKAVAKIGSGKYPLIDMQE